MRRLNIGMQHTSTRRRLYASSSANKWRRPTGTRAQEQHMHQQICAPGVKMTRRRMRLGLFRTWGKTREAGDPLGESRISFRTLSLLTTYAITYKFVTLSPQVAALRLHPFQPIKRGPSSHISVACQAAQNKRCGGFIPCNQRVRPISSRLANMDALNMRGSQGQWGVGEYNALVEGEFILPCLSLHCPTYTNNERNSKEPNKVKCWIDVISERVPRAWQTL